MSDATDIELTQISQNLLELDQAIREMRRRVTKNKKRRAELTARKREARK